MKLLKVAALAFLTFGFLCLFGGVQHYSIAKFTRDQLEPRSDGEMDKLFRPEIRPHFTKGGTAGLKSVIPFLWYMSRSNYEDPAIVISTHDSTNNRGYSMMSAIVLMKLVVSNERGSSFDLVPKNREERYSLLGMGTGSGSVNIGGVSGKRLRIQAEGYGVTKEGTPSYFKLDQFWTETRFKKWGLGISFSE